MPEEGSADLGTAWTALSSDPTWNTYGLLLQEVYRGAGRPSFRTVGARARRAGVPIAPNTARNLAVGVTHPQRRSVEGFLRGCGVDGREVGDYLDAWDRLSRLEGGMPQRPSTSSGSGAGQASGPLTPRERDALRDDRNARLRQAVERGHGIVTTTVFQLEDHTDKGYVLYVQFDRGKTSAAEVLTTIRAVFGDLFPGIPYWGEKLTEDEQAVGFGFTYIDHNALFTA